MARALGLKHAGCPHLPYRTVRSGSSRLGLGKLTPAPKRGWAHRNTRQACPGMEFLPGNSDFLSPNLEAQGGSVVSTSVLPCTARRLLSPPGASPHVSPLTLGFAATQSSPQSCTHGLPSFFLQTMAWPGPRKHAVTAGTRVLAVWLAFTSPSPAWESQTAPHFTAGKTEAQRGEGPGLQSRGWKVQS